MNINCIAYSQYLGTLIQYLKNYCSSNKVNFFDPEFNINKDVFHK